MNKLMIGVMTHDMCEVCPKENTLYLLSEYIITVFIILRNISNIHETERLYVNVDEN